MSDKHPLETQPDILKLKEYFKEEINSNRRFEEISTFQDLYDILEDRDALSNNVLLKLEPSFRNFVHSQRSKLDIDELVIPETVVSLISKQCSNDWETLGVKLKLSEEQISQCQNLEDVLMKFRDNCKGVSPEEMIFRLNRGLEKYGMGRLKNRVIELMRAENL